MRSLCGGVSSALEAMMKHVHRTTRQRSSRNTEEEHQIRATATFHVGRCVDSLLNIVMSAPDNYGSEAWPRLTGHFESAAASRFLGLLWCCVSSWIRPTNEGFVQAHEKCETQMARKQGS